MAATLLIGDVFERLAELPDRSVDLVVTSPPFLALRSYLPADHPDKAKEIGSEPTPAAFLSTLLRLTDEFRRVLAPHGSICVELGDTYSGSGGAGGDYGKDGLREGQQAFDGSASRSGWHRKGKRAEQHDQPPNYRKDGTVATSGTVAGGRGWPLAKSLSGIPTLYPWSLAYGRNLLNPEHTIEPWRIRNVIVWARPNPPVGALGDKFRPATSYITVACVGTRRYFDLDAVRTESATGTEREDEGPQRYMPGGQPARQTFRTANPAGAPPLDWHSDMPDEDGDWLWKLATAPYPGAHYATYPEALPKRLIEAMCPQRVCRTCGRPSERVVAVSYVKTQATSNPSERGLTNGVNAPGADPSFVHGRANRATETLGWTDCGCSADGTHWRNGLVLDPFAGSGTTLAVANGLGRDSIGIDLDERNADLVRKRCGMLLEVHDA